MSRLKVYYDGACVVCDWEMNQYRRRASDRLEFVDIAAPEFSAQAEGLDPEAVKQLMHVRTPDGRVVTGVDAFQEIWKVAPGFAALDWAARNPGLRPLMDAGYRLFAKYRHLLPKKKR